MIGDVRYTVPVRVLVNAFGGECVLFDMANGSYFGLNAVGACAWQLLAEGKTAAQICDAIELEFDAPREVIEADIEMLLAALKAKQLIVD